MQAVKTRAPQVSSTIVLSCANCGKTDEKLSRCSKCHFERYCGSECQKTHWPQHKVICPSILKREEFWTSYQLAQKKEISAWKTRKKIDIYTGEKGTIFYQDLFDIALSESMKQKLTKEQKKALDLGCGDGVSSIFLLERDWTVIAVDYKRSAIDNLRNDASATNIEWLQTNQLTTVVANIEEYALLEKVQFVIVRDVFPYCNPTKLRLIWDKIYNSLDVNGLLVGSFFVRGGKREQDWESWGAWFVKDEDMVCKLLNASSYEIIACRRRPKAGSPSAVIEFCAKKMSK